MTHLSGVTNDFVQRCLMHTYFYSEKSMAKHICVSRYISIKCRKKILRDTASQYTLMCYQHSLLYHHTYSTCKHRGKWTEDITIYKQVNRTIFDFSFHIYRHLRGMCTCLNHMKHKFILFSYKSYTSQNTSQWALVIRLCRPFDVNGVEVPAVWMTHMKEFAVWWGAPLKHRHLIPRWTTDSQHLKVLHHFITRHLHVSSTMRPLS